MITLNHATKWFKAGPTKKWILRDITDQISLDRNIGILGRNGAGKSTFMRILSGIETLNYGEVTSSVRLSWPLGFSGGVHSVLTGEENCRFIARIYGADAKKVLDFVGDFSELGIYLRMPVSTYSSGMRGRLSFGISMAIEFDVYLVDELTGVGDKRFQQKCRDAFRERQTRSSVVIVSHSKSTIKSYCDRAAVLHEGDLRIFDSLRAAERYYDQVMDDPELSAPSAASA
jgi:capsular polysaccharide transport system ATP-binding protein